MFRLDGTLVFPFGLVPPALHRTLNEVRKCTTAQKYKDSHVKSFISNAIFSSTHPVNEAVEADVTFSAT